jgi:hypothetical protein
VGGEGVVEVEKNTREVLEKSWGNILYEGDSAMHGQRRIGIKEMAILVPRSGLSIKYLTHQSVKGFEETSR